MVCSASASLHRRVGCRTHAAAAARVCHERGAGLSLGSRPAPRAEHHPRSDQSGHVEQPACRTRCPKEARGLWAAPLINYIRLSCVGSCAVAHLGASRRAAAHTISLEGDQIQAYSRPILAWRRRRLGLDAVHLLDADAKCGVRDQCR